jgi:transposase
VETLYKRCAGLNVHLETIVACVLLGDSETDMEKEIETFPTLMKDLFRLLKWLKEKEVTHIAMESTEFIASQFTVS